MESFSFDHLTILLDKEGYKEFTKVSYPIRYGHLSEIKTSDHLFQFNLNGEIKYIQGRGQNWPHPAEWLKRTVGNDWMYYSAGDYRDFYDLFGEYYFPCLSYPSNSILGDNPFADQAIELAMRSWKKLSTEVKGLIAGNISKGFRDFLIRVAANDEEALSLRACKLHTLIGGEVTVLPPDARHVDYEVIPIIVADGCLYDCGFCWIKSGQDFALRTQEDILEQIKNLKWFYGRDLRNYNSIFLGQHDALYAGRELLEFAATKAYEIFEFDRSYLRGCRLFLFGSADSMINAKEVLFEQLNRLPYYTYINIGLESADPATLAQLKKPITVEMVCEAFLRMIDVSRRYEKIEVTANFVFGENLPQSHMTSLLELTRNQLDRSRDKGAVYLSPLVEGRPEKGGSRREILRRFKEVKAQSRIPAYLYLIQRL